MSKVFISYRRDDSRSITDRVYDHLKKNLKGVEIFKDVLSIPQGENFLEYTRKKLSDADIFIPIIGKSWAQSLTDRADEEDYVRIEIEQALKSGIKILPILVEGARMPRAKELPESISKLSYINAMPVRPDPDFESDVAKLTTIIQERLLVGSSVLKQLLYKVKNNPLLKNAGLVLLAVVFLLGIKSVFFSSKEKCYDHKVNGIVANFSNVEIDPFSNTIMTIMEDSLNQDMINLSTTKFFPRSQLRYKESIYDQYFSSCDTSGLFINGYRDADQKVSNVYSTLVNYPVKLPKYLEDSLTITFPDSISFETDEDAGFIARVMALVLRASYQSTEEILSESFQIQKDYNLTAKSESSRKGKSPLGIIYFMRAHAYALDGNEERAKQFYKQASTYGDGEIERVSTIDTQRATRVSSIMEADPELRKIKIANVQKHTKIESAFMKFIKEVEKVLKKLFKKWGVKR